MSSQPTENDGPLIPMPSLTPDALREAVAHIVPSRLPELNRHLARAATNAQRTSSLGPLRAFTLHWGAIVNIERWPRRAARFHACQERAADPLADPEEARSAAAEVGRILRVASEEADSRRTSSQKSNASHGSWPFLAVTPARSARAVLCGHSTSSVRACSGFCRCRVGR